MKNYELIAWLMTFPAGAEVDAKDGDDYFRICLEDSCADANVITIELNKED